MRRTALIAALACSALPARAQNDTSIVHPLTTVMVTAERTRSIAGLATASVSRISAREIAATPHATLADVLRRIPGFGLVDFDGLGFDPQLIVRGFYGGGEAEYVVVLVDGKPAAQLPTGVIPWSSLPPSEAIEAIEVVRGSTSSLYGDAAIGATVNIITRRPIGAAPTRVTLSGGGYGTWNAGLDLAPGRGITIAGAAEATDGFRAHAQRSARRLQLGVPLIRGESANLGVSMRSSARTYEEPGALLASQYAEDRAASDPLFRLDNTKDQSHLLTIDGDRITGPRTRVSGSLFGEVRNAEAVRTLALAPGFGDTRLRDSRMTRAGSIVQLEFEQTPLPGADQLILGTEIGRGAFDSKYREVFQGTREDYVAASEDKGAVVASGEVERGSLALFGAYTVRIAEPVRLSLGARVDWVEDEFTPRAPDEVEARAASHRAVSPKAGLNIRYANGARHVGHGYVAASRSFKAPTLDQLYDQRPIPVPFPPFTLTTSNGLLAPSRGVNIEAGLYHGVTLNETLTLSLTTSAYQMDMRDEVDFDVATLSYVNIGRSRHRGVETGVRLSTVEGAAVSLNHTWQAATARAGEESGKYLKAIPRHIVHATASARVRGVDATLMVSRTQDAFIDDANTATLDGYTRTDLRLAYTLDAFSIFGEARNVFDAHYYTSGFLDPSGTGEAYYYPAAGRVIVAGVRRGW